MRGFAPAIPALPPCHPRDERAAPMRPVLFEVPGLHLRINGFGAMLCLAFLAAIALAAWRARHARLDPDWVYDQALAILLGGMVGARGFYLVEYWNSGRFRSISATGSPRSTPSDRSLSAIAPTRARAWRYVSSSPDSCERRAT